MRTKGIEHLDTLIKLTEKKLRRTLRTPSDFNMFITELKRSQGESISISTVKRLLGYVDSPHVPSFTVLSILARFNGFDDWECFVNSIESSLDVSSEFLTDTIIRSADLNPGDMLMLEWGCEKSCTLKLIAEDCFRVMTASHIKLMEGDTLHSAMFCVGHPFIAVNITRGEALIPAYTAARKGGLIRIEVIPAAD